MGISAVCSEFSHASLLLHCIRLCLSVRGRGNCSELRKKMGALWFLARVLHQFAKRWIGSKINEDKLSEVKLPLCGAVDNCHGQTSKPLGGSDVINSAYRLHRPAGCASPSRLHFFSVEWLYSQVPRSDSAGIANVPLPIWGGGEDFSAHRWTQDISDCLE